MAADDGDQHALVDVVERREVVAEDLLELAVGLERLFAVGSEELVRTALEKTRIAAVGPVVADALSRHGIRVKLMPQDSYFMKPLTATLESAFGNSSSPPA